MRSCEMVRAHDASFVVLDGFRGVAGFASGERDVRLFLYEVRTRLALLEVTSLVTLEASPHQESDSGALTVADGIIKMHNTLWGVRHRRHLEVQKLRAMNPLNGLHTITITADGITCYPRHEAVYRTVNYAVGTDRASLGLPELDEMLRGGLNRGTVTFLAGSPGAGKTLTALHYIMAGAAAGEPGLVRLLQRERRAVVREGGELRSRSARRGRARRSLAAVPRSRRVGGGHLRGDAARARRTTRYPSPRYRFERGGRGGDPRTEPCRPDSLPR